MKSRLLLMLAWLGTGEANYYGRKNAAVCEPSLRSLRLGRVEEFQLASPQFPTTYPWGRCDMTWHVETEPGLRIRFQPETMFLQAFDTLTLFDGREVQRGVEASIFQYFGRTAPTPVDSLGNSLDIVLVTGGSGDYGAQGFNVSLVTVAAEPTTAPSPFPSPTQQPYFDTGSFLLSRTDSRFVFAKKPNDTLSRRVQWTFKLGQRLADGGKHAVRATVTNISAQVRWPDLSLVWDDEEADWGEEVTSGAFVAHAATLQLWYTDSRAGESFDLVVDVVPDCECGETELVLGEGHNDTVRIVPPFHSSDCTCDWNIRGPPGKGSNVVARFEGPACQNNYIQLGIRSVGRTYDDVMSIDCDSWPRSALVGRGSSSLSVHFHGGAGGGWFGAKSRVELAFSLTATPPPPPPTTLPPTTLPPSQPCDCGLGYLTVYSDNGQDLVSPGFPSVIPPNCACSWAVTGGDGYSVRAQVEEFFLDREFQKLVFYDTNGLILQSCSSGDHCDSVTSTGNGMQISLTAGPYPSDGFFRLFLDTAPSTAQPSMPPWTPWEPTASSGLDTPFVGSNVAWGVTGFVLTIVLGTICRLCCCRLKARPAPLRPLPQSRPGPARHRQQGPAQAPPRFQPRPQSQPSDGLLRVESGRDNFAFQPPPPDYQAALGHRVPVDAPGAPATTASSAALVSGRGNENPYDLPPPPTYEELL